jgi:hypothetical protein
VNKDGTSLGAVVQAGAFQYLYFNGGYTKTLSTYTLAATPSAGSKIIAPGIIRATFRAYDQATVEGVVGPANISETRIIICDPSEIAINQYEKTVGEVGIRLSLVDNDTLNGADPLWLQFAPATNVGAAGVYQAAGTSLYLDDIKAATTLDGAALAAATSFDVDDASDFSTGTYIRLSYGVFGVEEDTLITGIAGNTLTVSPALGVGHPDGATVFHVGTPVWVKLTLPTPAGGPKNYYDVSIDMLVDVVNRN